MRGGIEVSIQTGVDESQKEKALSELNHLMLFL
jgi:hypothetical protein